MTDLELKLAEDLTVPPLDKRVTFAIHRISAQLARITNPVFNQYDIDLDTARIIVILLDRKTIPIGELIDLMLLPQSTVSHQLRRLEKRGLITRQRLAADQRSVAVTLTPQGKRVAKAANALSEDVQKTMVDGMAEEERVELMEQLEDMLQRLKRMVPSQR